MFKSIKSSNVSPSPPFAWPWSTVIKALRLPGSTYDLTLVLISQSPSTALYFQVYRRDPFPAHCLVIEGVMLWVQGSQDLNVTTPLF